MYLLLLHEWKNQGRLNSIIRVILGAKTFKQICWIVPHGLTLPLSFEASFHGEMGIARLHLRWGWRCSLLLTP
jgi:hypothetical protein